MKFSALAGNGMQRVSSDAAAVLFFLKEEKEKNGGAKKRATNGRPYVHRRKCDGDRRDGRTESSAPTFKNDGAMQDHKSGPLRR